MADKIARLSDFGNMAEAKTIVTIAEIENEDVTVQSFVISRGEHGNYARMKITRASGEVVSVNTASSFIVAALKEAKAKAAFPLAATFILHGKTWLVD